MEYKSPTTQEEVAANFEQLHPTMSANMAYYESSRCLFCYDAPCVQACPTSIDIPLFIKQINTGNIDGASKTIYDANYFGNICGKVCPTKVLCEGACVYNHQDVQPIDIGSLQAFATAHTLKKGKKLYQPAPENGKKVAVIGAGPAGISAACELRLYGYTVDVFEAKEHASGLCLYGIAPYKITNEEILAEMDYLQEQFGYTVHYNHPIRTKEQLQALENKYDAIFLGIGMGGTRSLGIEGEQLQHCIGATEFIEAFKLNPLNTFVGKSVVVVGGGNTAMDAASEAARMGASVQLVYRRDKAEMGAYAFEYDLAKNAGTQGLFNCNPIAILGKEKVEGIRLIKTTVEAGRVQTIAGSEFELACDMVILATGQAKLPDFLGLIDGLELDAKNRIVCNDGYQTTNPMYYASGDAVNGGAEVVNATGEAKIAAQTIHQHFS
ncbi:FAD-dependent oxidoreductase [Aureispira anguillae]|uniref:FAD-dependent oxidoreductase n=1 Tax=Aureispira anguillae TaxID=2864201 RepID=A0A915YD09_9BACT|nr:FAD-dependent oxidoreductase [Aureispira anguillae]BDS10786.1 FAD-dependent oxidoreductase [Aureispira anguillae]